MEFVIRHGIEDEKLLAVAETRRAAGMALLKYLTDRNFRVCVLKKWDDSKNARPFTQDHFIVIGDQQYFSTWLKEEYEKARADRKPTVEYVDSLDSEAVSAWAGDVLPKEVWVFFISHKFYDEYNRSGPTLRGYHTSTWEVASVSPDVEGNPELKALKNGYGVSAVSIREEENWDLT